MDTLTQRVAETLQEAFGDEISDLHFGTIVDAIAEAIAQDAIDAAEESLR